MGSFLLLIRLVWQYLECITRRYPKKKTLFSKFVYIYNSCWPCSSLLSPRGDRSHYPALLSLWSWQLLSPSEPGPDFTWCFLLFSHLHHCYPDKRVRHMSVMHRIFILGLVSYLKSRNPILYSHEWINIRPILSCFYHSRSLILLILSFFLFPSCQFETELGSWGSSFIAEKPLNNSEFIIHSTITGLTWVIAHHGIITEK